MNKKNILVLLCLSFAVVLLFALTGCGSSNSSDEFFYTAEQLEIIAALEIFEEAVEDENPVTALTRVSSSLTYNGSFKYSVFVSRLNTFLSGATVTDFELDNIGFDTINEDGTECRADLKLNYTVGTTTKTLTENVKLVVEKSAGTWAITSFCKYGSDPVSAFPPIL